jgi:hypothetical protein
VRIRKRIPTPLSMSRESVSKSRTWRMPPRE